MRWPVRVSVGSVAVVLVVLAGCGWRDVLPGGAAGEGAQEVVKVPQDVETISEAVEMVESGGMVLIGPGTYHESVTVDRPGVTVRGTERNDVVIDGEGRRPFGVVATADGIRVENLTVTSHTFYGVLVTGLHDEHGPAAHGLDGYETFDPADFPPVERFSVDHVTAYNNGLYGIYAFNARRGVIRNSYASGSADSGFYVGQCEDCRILLERNVAERNAIGFENANASDSVVVAGNRFSNNRVGMTLTSNYQEAFTPQRRNMVVGNVISDNAESDSPAHAEGGFGVGVGIAGGRENVLSANRIEGNPVAGVLLQNTEDLEAVGNVIRRDVFGANGVDIANVAADRAPTRATCVNDAMFESALPMRDDTTPWFDTEDCGGAGDGDSAGDGDGADAGADGETGDGADTGTDASNAPAQPAASMGDLPDAATPSGVSFLDVTPPVDQPTMADVGNLPEPLPEVVELPDLTNVDVPPENLLIDRAGV